MKGYGVILLALAALAATAEAKGRIGCYYGSWAVYRQGPGHFDASQIDPTLCSHILYAFAKISWEGEVQVYDDYNDVGDEWHIGQFTKLEELKKKSPNTKFIISVGGWNLGPGPFKEVVVNPQKRQKMVDSGVEFCRKYKFDGLDIDWEYQDSIGGSQAEKDGFSELLRLFRQRFNTEKLELGIASQANFALMEADYDWKVVSESVDFINLMSYDLHGAWEKYTGHLGPLYPMAQEQGYDRNLNIQNIIKKMLELGADPAKINLGLPTYGRCFTLADPNQNGMYAPVTGPCPMGQYVPEAGILGYDEICHNNWPVKVDPEQKVSYAFQGTQWVGYDDKDTIKRVMDYAKSVGINNWFIWSIETDDFSGTCDGAPFPLLKAINANA